MDNSTFLRKGLPGWMLIVAVILFVSFDSMSISANVKHETLLEQLQNKFIIVEDNQTAATESTETSSNEDSPITTEEPIEVASTNNSSSPFSTVNFVVTIFGAIIAAGSSGIPLGYLIHELYYYIKWNSPVSQPGLLSPLIGGWDSALFRVVIGIEQPIYDSAEASKEDINKINNEAYLRNIKKITLGNPEMEGELKRRTRRSWHFITELVDKTIMTLPQQALYRYRQFETRIDMMHSLGASHLGFSIGFGIYLIVKLLLSFENGIELVYYIFGALFVTLVTIALLSIGFEKKRMFAEVFISFLLFLSWRWNINVLSIGQTDSEGILQLLPGVSFAIFGFCFVLVFLWIVARIDVYKKRDDYFEPILIIVLFISATIYSWPMWNTSMVIIRFLKDFEWTIIQSILIYCAISIAFTKNRAHMKEKVINSQINLLKEYIRKETKNLDDEPGENPKYLYIY